MPRDAADKRRERGEKTEPRLLLPWPLLPGERLETEESIVIIGDVPQEAVVVSQSDIVVLGELSEAPLPE